MNSGLDRLVVRQSEPFNAETPLTRQTPPVTPVEEFYVRSHFEVPRACALLAINGAVVNPFEISLAQLQQMDSQTIITTMECAGNGRAYLDPPVSGVSWGLGAVGTAAWTGVKLRTLLDRARPLPSAADIVFVGADQGVPSRSDRACRYERSLNVDADVLDSSLIAYAMNGAPLSPAHGAPIRLVVPGWYGMASVKWLERITVATSPFRGYFQVDDYVIRSNREVLPCREMRVRSLILRPDDGDSVRVNQPVEVAGYAWSGYGPIASIEVSSDGGKRWHRAAVDQPMDGRWAAWTFDWTPRQPGKACLVARARDELGNIQPLKQFWSQGGYGNNASVVSSITALE